MISKIWPYVSIEPINSWLAGDDDDDEYDDDKCDNDDEDEQ